MVHNMKSSVICKQLNLLHMGLSKTGWCPARRNPAVVEAYAGVCCLNHLVGFLKWGIPKTMGFSTETASTDLDDLGITLRNLHFELKV
jgi:hypothetical protein